MLTKNIVFKNYNTKKLASRSKNLLFQIINHDINDKNNLLSSLNKNYKYSYSKNLIKKLKKFKEFNLIGMGGSILGTEAIYSFLKKKIKKKFNFFNNLKSQTNLNNKKLCNLIISKSGNTLEVVANLNIIVKKKDKNIIITEKKK